MRILRHTDADFSKALARLQRKSEPRPEVEASVREIIRAVRENGDAALIELTQKFGGPKLTAKQLRMAAKAKVDAATREAIATSHANVRAFAERSLRKNWSMRNVQGARVGEKFDPFQRVGIYVPGGTAPLVTTSLMTVPLARVAGCREIAVFTPCGKDGAINAALLFAIRTAGATEVYRLGGAQAIAAMACGTATIRPVQKIFGPGNAYVVAAKRLLFGHVAIDLLPGPSEILILADDSAEPRFVAADLLAQAEHGSGHERVWLATPSGALLGAVQKEIERQLPGLSRREFIERALRKNGWLIQVKTIEDAVALANQFAPEHCEIMARHATELAGRIVTAGGVFFGGYSPTVLGGYVVGPSPTLPPCRA